MSVAIYEVWDLEQTLSTLAKAIETLEKQVGVLQSEILILKCANNADSSLSPPWTIT